MNGRRLQGAIPISNKYVILLYYIYYITFHILLFQILQYLRCNPGSNEVKAKPIDINEL